MRFTCLIALAVMLTAGTLVQAQTTALRIRFGMKDAEGADWSGKVTTSSGQVKSIRGWRWMPGDHADGNAFVVNTRRTQPQNRAEQQRVKRGEKMPMTDNGVIVTLAGAGPDSEITFEAVPGKATFKLSDVPYGKRFNALSGNLAVDRVPPAAELAATPEDEDYPTVAVGKDGTVYVAYLAFTHGQDFQSVRERPTTPESGPVAGPLAAGEIKKIVKPEDLDYLAEPVGGEQVYLRIQRDNKWSDPIAVTDGKQELYRPAIAVDGDGKVWVFYSAHVDPDKNLDHGNWELMARRFDADGTSGGEAVNVSQSPGSDFMPAAATDSKGKVCVTWVGGREKGFNVFVAAQDGQKFTAPKRISDLAGNEWEPAIAADGAGHLAVAWDTYTKGDYDIYVAQRSEGGAFDAAQPVAASLAFEVRPSLTYDSKGRLWIAYEESGDLWGKDFGALKKKGIPLYQTGRTLAVKVLADGKWLTPPDIMDAMPGANASMAAEGQPKKRNRTPAGPAGSIAPCFPRIAAGGDGGIWLAFRGRPGGNWRVNVGSVWCEYVTRLNSDGWAPAAWMPRSYNVLDNRPALAATKNDGLTVVFSGDGRGENNAPKLAAPARTAEAGGGTVIVTETPAVADDEVPPPATVAAAAETPAGRRGGRKRNLEAINQDLFVAHVRAAEYASPTGGDIALQPAEAEKPAAPAADVESERNAVGMMRDYRYKIGSETLQIWRGEFHRHTEFSPDGGGDGGLLDMWRYAIDAANLDWIGDGDHDFGNGREYSWWTTQKAVTLFTIPNHFVPMFSYERSVAYPEGHRNCMFARRGIRSLPRLPMTSPDKESPAPDTNMLYMYLHHFDGLCASHTSATGMGTDWRNNDPIVEPFVEIYQGDRNNYERPDAPRSAVTEAKLKQSTPEKESLGGWEPKGFVNLALKKGYRLAFESSSDHISTHLSYCNILVTEPTREAILDAVKKRRVYGATDNIIADVRCKAGGVEHLMGEEFSTADAPTLSIHLIGPQKFSKVVIIKDDEEVHSIQPDKQDVSFTWTDPKPTAGKTSYYYVRGEQVPDMEGVTSGELVWASPMWIKYEH